MVLQWEFTGNTRSEQSHNHDHGVRLGTLNFLFKLNRHGGALDDAETPNYRGNGCFATVWWCAGVHCVLVFPTGDWWRGWRRTDGSGDGYRREPSRAENDSFVPRKMVHRFNWSTLVNCYLTTDLELGRLFYGVWFLEICSTDAIGMEIEDCY